MEGYLASWVYSSSNADLSRSQTFELSRLGPPEDYVGKRVLLGDKDGGLQEYINSRA